MDLFENHQFDRLIDGEIRKHTLAISSPILTNGLMSFKTAPIDVARLCLSNRASNTWESRTWENFADLACSMAWSATADIESCVTRTYSRAALGFPSLSTNNRTTSNCQDMSPAMTDHQTNATCLYSVVSVEVQADRWSRFQSCQGTCV